MPRGLDDARGDGAGDASHPHRLPGHRDDLPAPRSAREHGRDHRRDLRRPARRRRRRGLEPAGVRRLRDRAPAAAASASTASTRGSRRWCCCSRRSTATSTARTCSCGSARCEPKPVQRPHPPIAIGGNGPTRTLRTVARFAQHWNSTAGIDHWPAISAVLDERCAEIGRDPSTIERSVNLRYDASRPVEAVAEQAAAFAEAGADIGIVYLPVPHTPAGARADRRRAPSARRLGVLGQDVGGGPLIESEDLRSCGDERSPQHPEVSRRSPSARRSRSPATTPATPEHRTCRRTRARGTDARQRAAARWRPKKSHTSFHPSLAASTR